jgi:hypothetical protein
MFQARVPAVPLAPAHDGPPDANANATSNGTNGTSNGNTDGAPTSTSDGSADGNRDEQETPPDDERTSRPEPDVSRR